MFQNLGAYATFRFTSGAPYTKCNPGPSDRDVVSGDNCDREFPEGAEQCPAPRVQEAEPAPH